MRDDPAGRPGAGALGAHLRRRARRVRPLLRALAGHRQPDRARRGRRRHRRPVDRRAGHAADDADLPHRWCGRSGHRRRSAPRGRAVRGPYASRARRAWPARRAWCASPRTRARAAMLTIVGDDGTEDSYGAIVGRLRVDDGDEVQAGQPAHRGPLRPEGAHGDQGRPGDPAVPRRGGPEGLPRPGRVDPRQAHRADRAPDDPSGRRAGAGRHRASCRASGSTRRCSARPTAAWWRAACAPPRVAPS